ncbi:MAG: hypothetical protein HDR30_01655 [Lachnospiraceae bacterium]|nr:hypothetical protein [Lachnospiraceae bacterium]
MELRSILKKCMIDFLMIQAGITFAIGVIGCIKTPALGVTHYSLFMPFVYAFFCVIPSFVIYSAKELSIKQMLIRKVIQFLLIEFIVMLISYIIGTLNNTFICIAIILAVIVVYIVVNVLEYLFCKSAADAMTKKIQRIKEKEQHEQCHE